MPFSAETCEGEAIAGAKGTNSFLGILCLDFTVKYLILCDFYSSFYLPCLITALSAITMRYVNIFLVV